MITSGEERKISESGHDRWQPRPVASVLLRGAVFAVPIIISAAISVAVSRRLLRVDGATTLIARFLISFAISVVLLRLTDRLSRRLLPLAVLWKLTLVFPTAAPSRWKLAREAANVGQLERIAEEARRHGVQTEPARAAGHILTLVAAVEAHDRGTRGHSERVRIYTDLIAEEIGLDDDDRNKLRWAALLHDVGKLMVPAEVLNKPAKLDDLEFDLVKQHPIEGKRFIEPLADWLGEWVHAIEQHHERFDGAGYPHGLSGSMIARAARIVAVADSYEVMTARRPYKRPMKANAAREELVRCSGSQFDPAMVRAFLQVSLGKLRIVAGPLAWLAQTPFLRGIEQFATTAGAATTSGAIVLGLVPAVQIAGPNAADAATPPSNSRTLDGARIDPETGMIVGPSGAPSPTPTPSAEPTPTPEPTEITDPTPEPSVPPTSPPPTGSPTASPSPTTSPSPSPSHISTPTVSPTRSPDPVPSSTPTREPSPETSDPPVPPPTSIGRVPFS